jgi:hypothetical protein
MNTKNNYTLSELLLNRKQMEAFVAAEVKKTRTYVTLVCNVHLSLLNVCGIFHCLRTIIFLIFVLSNYLHYDGALN